MGSELSASCFNDYCDECAWGRCGCACHEFQDYDLVDGWVDDGEDER